MEVTVSHAVFFLDTEEVESSNLFEPTIQPQLLQGVYGFLPADLDIELHANCLVLSYFRSLEEAFEPRRQGPEFGLERLGSPAPVPTNRPACIPETCRSSNARRHS